MVIHELSADECRDVLERARFGRLACARADQPYIVPFFFYLDRLSDSLYSFSTVGQKIDWMRGNPRVCVEVDDIVDQTNWTTVVAIGRYVEITNSRQDEPERRRASDLFQDREMWWVPGIGKRTPNEEHVAAVVYRIVIEEVTGRRAGPRSSR
ncbi:MAG TPA: pyridoxamine 5'-phosphate oxidase family protein [Vicinamibacterales bacterium]|nr:pyridoxamine 5'-phosphate oxidase family protein [Vicinamibacterales bacterium]